jgi:hypothetical protein
LLKPRAARLELHNTFWEWSDEWVEPHGTPFDLMYRSCDAIEADVEAKLGRGEAEVGYSTVPGPTRGGGYQDEPAGAGGHHPFLRAADSFGLSPTGPSQPQSPDRGLAGQLFRPLIRCQPAFQPR